MKYIELLEQLTTLTDEQLDSEICVIHDSELTQEKPSTKHSYTLDGLSVAFTKYGLIGGGDITEDDLGIGSIDENEGTPIIVEPNYPYLKLGHVDIKPSNIIPY